MQGTLATILLITAAVSLTAIAVDYAVVVSQQTLQPSGLPQMERIHQLEDLFVNQTSGIFNGTIGLPTGEVVP